MCRLHCHHTTVLNFDMIQDLKEKYLRPSIINHGLILCKVNKRATFRLLICTFYMLKCRLLYHYKPVVLKKYEYL